MPIKLEISGDNIANFYSEAMNVFLVLSKAQEMFKPVQTAAPVNVDPPASEPVGDVTTIDPPIRQPSKPRGRPPKAETATEDPLGLNDKPAETAKALTLDDMRQRVRELAAKGGTTGQPTPEGIALVKKLFVPFGVNKAGDLKPEQFDKFWQDTQSHVDGLAK